MMCRRREGGQSLAELAMLLPVLMLILLGSFDLGRAFSVWMALANGSREGARYACLYPTADLADIRRVATADMAAEGIAPSAVTIEVSAPHGTGEGNPIRVTAQYSMPLMSGFLFGGRPVAIRASTQMMIIGRGTG
jgi:Flp pilus assembly protein TadG